jgi:hypothetical protein
LFIAVAKVRGAHDALLMIDDKYQRKVYRERLGCGTPLWWKPEMLWNTWSGLSAPIEY